MSRDGTQWLVLKGFSGAVLLFLLLPLFVVVLVSFNPTKYPSFPPADLSFKWYESFFADSRLLSTLLNSLIVALGSALVAGIVGLISAIGFVRRRFRAKNLLVSLLFLPMLISPVVVGVALTAFLTSIGVQKSYLFLIAGHSTLVLPYVFVTVRAQLYGFDRSIEEAALILGANELEAFTEVTLPLVMPGLAAGMLLAFVISFGEFTATQFWVQPSTVTAPVEIYTMVRTSLTPKINAMAAVLMVVTVIIPLLLDVLLQKDLILRSA